MAAGAAVAVEVVVVAAVEAGLARTTLLWVATVAGSRFYGYVFLLHWLHSGMAFMSRKDQRDGFLTSARKIPLLTVCVLRRFEEANWSALHA